MIDLWVFVSLFFLKLFAYYTFSYVVIHYFLHQLKIRRYITDQNFAMFVSFTNHKHTGVYKNKNLCILEFPASLFFVHFSIFLVKVFKYGISVE